MKFIWSEWKAKENLKKHGVGFPEAITVFDDPLSILMTDDVHSYSEERLILMGQSNGGRILVVVHTQEEDMARRLSVREATTRERKQYEEGEI